MILLKKLLVVGLTSSIHPLVISQSIKIAQKQQSHVTLFSVANEPVKAHFAWRGALSSQALTTEVLNTQQLSLDNVIDIFNDKVNSVDTHTAVGVPFIEVTKKVQQDNYDLVILAAKANEYSRKSFFCSTTIHLMRKCPCPILTIGTNKDKPIKRIVAAIDIYPLTMEGHKLNENILLWANTLAKLENATLHVVHAWQLPGEDYLKGWGYTSEIDRLEIVMKEKQERQKCFDKIIDENFSDHKRPVTQLIKGLAQEEIPLYVEDNDIDLIVMGTVCRVGIAGFFIGNTAESILSEVSCSVLTLKPDGFISPIK